MPLLFHLILFLPIYFIGGLIAKIAGVFVNNAKDVDATAITHLSHPPIKVCVVQALESNQLFPQESRQALAILAIKRKVKIAKNVLNWFSP